MTVSFTYPLAALLLVLVPALWFWPARPRTTWHGVIRTLLFVLLIAALMQPVTVLEVEQERHVVVLDETASMSSSARSRGAQAAAALVSELAGRGDSTMIRLGAGDAESAAERRMPGRSCPDRATSRRWPKPGDCRAVHPAGPARFRGPDIRRPGHQPELGPGGRATGRTEHTVHVFNPESSSSDPFPARLQLSVARPGEALRGPPKSSARTPKCNWS